MRNTKLKRIVPLVLLLALVGSAFQTLKSAQAADTSNQAPDLPAICSSIQVEAGNSVSRQAFATGVQIYRWDGTAWVFVEPAAGLFADANYHGKIGIHYRGPTWESNSGSIVVAARVLGTGCIPDPNSIAWLLLKKVSTDGPGIFSNVAFIQRVNTTGGMPPTNAGTTVGELAEVPYTAEYYFYRASN
ncbi:MAG TPA: DUF3455 domain-containing protein [Pyrinomonadaceae bacterium]|nr:DUF3455 domain-containing protein [Pyrinomonadaceae bacterium]